MSRWLLWISTASLGAAAVFVASFLGPMTFPLLVVAVAVVARANRLVALSGVLVGFGGLWLLLASRRATGGAPLEIIDWAFGIVPLVVGLTALVPVILHARPRPGSAHPGDPPKAESGGPAEE